MEKMYNSDGKFLRWKHVFHNVKKIHNTAAHMKAECHSLFNEWEMKGVENILIEEANTKTGVHFEVRSFQE